MFLSPVDLSRANNVRAVKNAVSASRADDERARSAAVSRYTCSACTPARDGDGDVYEQIARRILHSDGIKHARIMNKFKRVEYIIIIRTAS